MRPQPPAWLEPEAAELWRRLADRIPATTAARRDLAAYCLAASWWRRARAVVDRLDPDERTVSDGHGGSRAHPAVDLERLLAGEVHQLSLALGLEPAGRPYHRPTSILFLDEGDQS